MLAALAFMVFVIAGLWKTFEKAGQPGWGALVPFYNGILLLNIAQKPLWWILLFFIPLVNLIIAIIIAIDVAKNFGKGTGFGLGLAFLGFIFYPILGFGDAEYNPVDEY
ncbi:MAG: signal peptidase I [Planctomicrobium sp.]|nr:signal peptidase I [Planctomicrobium sp.]